MKTSLTTTVIAGLAFAAGPAFSQSPDYMVEDCQLASQQFFQEFDAGTEASYQGQRTDGTHAVNGTIYLETRGADYACSYNRAGDTLVDFFAENQSWPDFVKGNGSPYQAGSGGGSSSAAQQVTTERVRFPSGQSSDSFPAQLPANMTVRYELGAQNGQFLDVQVSPANAPLVYRILNPDGSELLGEVSPDVPYRGQLWQSGDHVVEVINRTGSTVQFDIFFGIE